jgi:hypothetical protein
MGVKGVLPLGCLPLFRERGGHPHIYRKGLASNEKTRISTEPKKPQKPRDEKERILPQKRP